MEKYLHHHHNQKVENPSFSSTLLDAIYRSIDESNGNSKREDEFLFYKETMKKKHSSSNNHKDDERMSSLKKACMIEKWMEEKVSYEKVSVRRKSIAEFDIKKTTNVQPVLLNSSSSSSESSSGGGFSSSESDSVYGLSSKSNSTSYTMQKPKPIRTSLSARPADVEFGMYHNNNHYHHQQKASKSEGSFVKTKSRALKIYGDLKKVKQPISPGGRLASFLNSIFTTGNPKKAKISSSSGYEERKLKSEQTSTCSSASSFSRSCLSKTPSSRNGAKRSVRFYPVSVIVDEDSRPCGHKNLYEDKEEKINATIMAIAKSRKPNINSNEKELKFHVMNESRRVEHVARDLLKNYQKKKQEEFNNLYNAKIHDQEMEDIDDDAESYASSDLFELDNLSAIGTIDHRYREELPVYETTHLDTNRAIANGFIL